MKIRVDILLEQIKYILKNAKTYSEKGYLISADDNFLNITYNKHKYRVKIIEQDNQIVWHLSPYNNSFFITSIDNKGKKFNMILFAIKENEELYLKKSRKGY